MSFQTFSKVTPKFLFVAPYTYIAVFYASSTASGLRRLMFSPNPISLSLRTLTSSTTSFAYHLAFLLLCKKCTQKLMQIGFNHLPARFHAEVLSGSNPLYSAGVCLQFCFRFYEITVEFLSNVPCFSLEIKTVITWSPMSRGAREYEHGTSHSCRVVTN